MCVGTAALARKAVLPDGSAPSVGSPSSRPQSASRRPTSNIIAATPLERIPQQFVIKATQLMESGATVLEQQLHRPLADAALRRQGVDSYQVLASVPRKGVPVEPREARQAVQLLAQVLWDEHSRGSDPLQPYIPPPTLEQRPPKDPTDADLLRASNVRHNAIKAHQRWSEKVQKVNSKRNQRHQQLADESYRWNVKHHQDQLRTDAFKEWREQHLDERRCDHYCQERGRDHQIAKKKAVQRDDHARERVSSNAARVALNTFHKEMCKEENEELTTARLEKSGNAQMGAGVRRQRALSARASGRPSLHINREIAHLQAARCERLNAEKRLAWYENLENNRSATSGGVPPTLLESS